VLPALDETALARVAGLERLQSSEYDLSSELVDLVGEAALMELTVVGTPEDCRAKVRRLLAVPRVSELAFNIYGGAPRTAISEFVREVIQPLRPVPAAATVSQE
jgi:alkanesulfonate monooxygenase SsuD/methylene tetrahydromethanopterin reductase-like flavin-dependent oxidoreductase (luciferase family)